MYGNPYSRHSMPKHMSAQPYPAQTPGTPPAPPQMDMKQESGPRGPQPQRQPWGSQYQGMNWMQNMQGNPMMQQFMGPGSKYAQMIGSNPYLSQLQNIPFLGSLFGAPMQSMPGMNQQPQQPQIGGPLPPTSI